jgi:DNA-binding transcriptional ArsR family regulator
LAALFPISRPAVSQHLRLLRDAGLVRAGSDRRGAPNELVDDQLVLVERWVHDQVRRSNRMSAGEPP